MNMKPTLNRLPMLCFVSALTATALSAQPRTVSADDFVDSVGVNVHLHWSGSLYYNNFPLVKSRLAELKVRHVRDGLVDTTWQGYYDNHNQLGQANIKGVFISSPGQSATLLENYPSRLSSSFEAYEAPNEYNQSGDPVWQTTLLGFLPILYSSAKNAAGKSFPVYGPSLTQESAYQTLGDVSRFYDYGNMHNYLGGWNPGTLGWGPDGYGSIIWNLQLLDPYVGGKPIASTENGYWNDRNLADSVPQIVSGKYMPRMLLEHYRNGIVRTYIYELCDYSLPAPANVSSSYGLLNADGSPKPAFTAVQNLLALLADPGSALSPAQLHFTLSNNDSNVHQMVFQKRDGSYYVALWIELPSYYPNAQTAGFTNTQSVTIHVSDPVYLSNVHQWNDDGSVTHTPGVTKGSASTVLVSDKLVILEYVPGATSVTVTSEPPGLMMAIDSAVITTPFNFHWAPDSIHELDATVANSQQSQQAVFARWSDGGTANHVITVGSSPHNYLASYTTQYRLATLVVPPGAGSIAVSPSSGSGFYQASPPLVLTAVPSPGFTFSSFSGAASGSNTKTSLALAGPATVTATFSCAYVLFGPATTLPATANSGQISVQTGAGCSYSATTTAAWLQIVSSGNGAVSFNVSANNGASARTGTVMIGGQATQVTQAASPALVPVTIVTKPAGLGVIVDGASYTTTPLVFQWIQASVHKVTMNNPQYTGTTSNIFSNWSDAVYTMARTITTPLTAQTYIASFVPQYKLSTMVTPANSGSIIASPSSWDGYYWPNTRVTLTAVPSAGFTFSSFAGAALGSTTKTSLALAAPATVTATFSCAYALFGPAAPLAASAGTGQISVQTGAGCSYSATTTAPWLQIVSSGNGAVSFNLSANNGSSARTGTVSIGGQAAQVTQAASPASVPVSIVTKPAGLGVIVDGALYTTTPIVFQWTPGSVHKVTMNNPQYTGTTSNVFSNWSDAVYAMSRTITTPLTAQTYIASFVPQYKLSTTVTPANSGAIVVSPSSWDGYYWPSTNITLRAIPGAGCIFSGYSGEVGGANPDQKIMMKTAISVQAMFKCDH
jgi:hypothetical protein